MLRNINKVSKIMKAQSLGLAGTSRSFHSSKSLKKPDNFMNGSNSVYLEQMYDNWVRDRNSVHPSWDAYFSNVTNGLPSDQAFAVPPTLGGGQQTISPIIPTGQTSRAPATQDIQKMITDSSKILVLVKAYQRRGHELADLDPLSIFFLMGNFYI